MDRCFSPDCSGQVVLRTINSSDLEDLRAWKNANPQAFFFKGEIQPADQRAWYQDFLRACGCLVRLRSGFCDVDERTRNVTVQCVEKVQTDKTRAVKKFKP